MRYYTIEISDRKTGQLVRRYSSRLQNGAVDPGALNVELDIPVQGFAEPLSQGGTGASVRVWGISLEDISQASNLNGKAIKVYGGMQKGLPLANPAQAGLLCQGFIFQCFGNWIGTAMTLDMIILPDTGSEQAPKNLQFNWLAGTELRDAVTTTLRNAFPGYRILVNVRSGLVRGNPEWGEYDTLSQFAHYVQDVSQDIVGGDNYRGVEILLREGQFIVRDGSLRSIPKQIQFFDLIGQPTWVEFPTIQVTMAMRADLFVSDFIQMPPAVTTTTAGSLSQFRNRSVFQGIFQIVHLRHLGNFRQPDGESWITAIDANPTASEPAVTPRAKNAQGFAMGGV